jgi:hypothetical protein
MTYFYGRAVPLDGPRATITADERDDYKRDVQVLLGRGGRMMETWICEYCNISNFMDEDYCDECDRDRNGACSCCPCCCECYETEEDA